MKKIKNNKMLGNFLIIFIYTMVLEIFFRLASNIKILDTSIFRVAIGYAIISVIISFILSYFNKKVSNIVIILVSFIFTIYAFLQMGFNNFIGVYMSVNTSSQLGAVVDYVRGNFVYRNADLARDFREHVEL